MTRISYRHRPEANDYQARLITAAGIAYYEYGDTPQQALALLCRTHADKMAAALLLQTGASDNLCAALREVLALFDVPGSLPCQTAAAEAVIARAKAILAEVSGC